MTAKIGLQIHPVFTQANNQTRPYSAQEKADLDSFLLQLQPSSIIVLNDFGWAIRFANMLPNTKVIFRKQHDRDGDFWNLTTEDKKPYTPQMHFDGTKEHHNPRIMLNLSNEGMGKTVYSDDGKPDYAAITKMITWLVGCMDIFGAAGVALVTPNWGVGLPDMKWFKSDSLEWKIIKPLFEAFKRWPIHALGIHAYWRKDGFTTDDYMNRPRDLAAALDKLGYPVHSMQTTEYGIDAIDGHPGPWMDAYGDTEAGQKEYARLLVKGQRENLNLPFVHGIDVFSWGCYPRWVKYDISKAKHVQAEMIASNMNLPSVTLPYVPPPADKGTGEKFTIVTATVLQAQPSADTNCYVGTLSPGESVEVYRYTYTVADGQTWHYFERTSTPVGQSPCGWTSHRLPPPDPIVLPPPQPTAEAALKYIAELWTERKTCATRIAEIEEELDILSKIWTDAAKTA
jgi:hypothetical protein